MALTVFLYSLKERSGRLDAHGPRWRFWADAEPVIDGFAQRVAARASALLAAGGPAGRPAFSVQFLEAVVLIGGQVDAVVSAIHPGRPLSRPSTPPRRPTNGPSRATAPSCTG